MQGVLIFLLIVLAIFLGFFSCVIIDNAEKDKLAIPKINFKLLYNTRKKEIIFYSIYILAIFLIYFFKFKFSAQSIKNILILITFFLGSIIDIKYKMIPDLLNLFLVLVALIFWKIHIFSGIGIFVIMLIIYKFGEKIFKKEALGFGDVKNFTAIGFVFGFSKFIGIFFYSFLFAGIFGIALILYQNLRKIPVNTSIPFIPFINIAIIYLIIFQRL